MLYLLTGIGLILFVVAVAALIGLVRSGQLDDLDTPPARMLAEDMVTAKQPSAPSDRQPAASGRRPVTSDQRQVDSQDHP